MAVWRRLLCAMVMLVGVASVAHADVQQDRQQALDLLGRGVAAFRVGDIVAATRHWTDAARLCRLAGAPGLEAEALARRGEAYRVGGHFREAAADLTASLARAREAEDAFLIAASSGALGNLAFLSRRTATAEPLLQDALSGARRLNDAALAGASLNDLGNLYAVTGRPTQAAGAYAEAARLAGSAGDQALAATAETNAARLALDANDGTRAADLLRAAADRLARLEPGYKAGLALVAVGTAASGGDRPSPALRSIAERAFQAARATAERLGNPVLASLALGGLGRVRYQSGHMEAAARLTQQALFQAQQATAPDIAWRWDWQQARIDRALGHETAALASFRRAVAVLQSVRQDIPVEYRDGRSSFRDTFGPLYLEFVDLLLRRASRDRPGAAPLIHEARDVAETLKATELQDYFRDPCVTDFEARQRGIETVAADTAVIYPIVLPDRLELLVTAGGVDSQVTVPIPAPRLRTEVEQFRRLLEKRTTNEFLEPAQRLYDLIVRPVDAILAGRGITTLVVVPDGVLRTIPLAALHDGRHFLIERYAIATVPGLRLVDPRPLTPETRRTLAVGVSQSREGFPPLPNVASELAGIQRLEHGTTLLDATFLRQRFARELRDVDYTVVHIASHSQFGSDPSRSFVLAYDGQLSLDDLENSIKFARFRDLGLELLALSACQTAVGDDRAALGMAGLALKAGARSVLATLWVVNDEASGQLAVAFYRQLQNETMSKAGALQAAQRAMIEDPLLGHPAYWAAFLLIGNWL